MATTTTATKEVRILQAPMLDRMGMVGIGEAEYFVLADLVGYRFEKFTSQGGGECQVFVRGGKPARCTCKDHAYRRRECKHMTATAKLIETW